MQRPLVIGYGNPLREDDGVGLRAAELVAERFSHEAVQVLTARQLTPELAAPVGESSMVIFLDAECGETPGQVMTRELALAQSDTESWTHQGSPAQILALAKAFSNSAPQAFLITGSIDHLDWSEQLSPTGEETARRMFAAATALLNQ